MDALSCTAPEEVPFISRTPVKFRRLCPDPIAAIGALNLLLAMRDASATNIRERHGPQPPLF